MLQLLAATSNKHKIAEFQEMLCKNGLAVTIISPETINGFPELAENGTTFEENACQKAIAASKYADMSAFADDSGLEVVALNGAPGVFSARYAGENATDADRIAKLLKEMEGKTDRTARFVCVIALAYRGDVVATFRGEVTGEIADAPRGTEGFGYDPVFIPDGYDRTFAELGAEIKDRISHRANAFAKTVQFIGSELETMDDFEFV